jgi:hypothetical protein
MRSLWRLKITKKPAQGWDKDWIVLASVWQAAACTILISGGHGANAGICASTQGLTGPFTIADLDLKVSLGTVRGCTRRRSRARAPAPFSSA